MAECVADAGCGAYIATQLSENLVEAGFALAHSPLAGSALAGKGVGLVVEAHVDSLPVGKRNELGEGLKLPPVVPRLVAAYHLGSYTYDDPYPQYTLAAHLLPPVGSSEGRGWSVGGTASAALPIVEQWWWGAEADYTYGEVRATLVGTPARLRQYDEIKPYVRAIEAACEPCVDRVDQHALALRAGPSIEPHPALFGYARGGVLIIDQRLDLAIDGSRWGLGGTLPTFGFGGGVRIADRVQIGTGATMAWKSPAVTTTRRGMIKLVAAIAGRFGDARYRSTDR